MKPILWDSRLDLPLLCIRMASAVESPAERRSLREAWRQALQHGPGPTTSKRTPKRIRPAPFTAANAAVSPKKIEQLNLLLEMN